MAECQNSWVGPTGTAFVSAGAEADPSVASAVSTDAVLAATSAAAALTGANTTALAANTAPAAPITISAAAAIQCGHWEP